MILQACMVRIAQLVSNLIDIFSLEPTRIPSHDRSVLENVILPFFANDRCCHKILFVGCAAYTKWYEELFQHQEYWTIDPKKVKRKYGSGHHLIDSITHIRRYVPKGYFDLIVMNGVIGFGLNRLGDIEQAVEACYTVLAHQGILLIGWNDTAERTPIDIRAVRALSHFREYAFEPLHACHYRTAGAYRHTFSFYRKES